MFTPEDFERHPELQEFLDALLADYDYRCRSGETIGPAGHVWHGFPDGWVPDTDAMVATAMASLDDDLRAIGG